MKFVERGRYADPDAARAQVVEIANTVEAVQDGRIRCVQPAMRRAAPRRPPAASS